MCSALIPEFFNIRKLTFGTQTSSRLLSIWVNTLSSREIAYLWTCLLIRLRCNTERLSGMCAQLVAQDIHTHIYIGRERDRQIQQARLCGITHPSPNQFVKVKVCLYPPFQRLFYFVNSSRWVLVFVWKKKTTTNIWGFAETSPAQSVTLNVIQHSNGCGIGYSLNECGYWMNVSKSVWVAEKLGIWGLTQPPLTDW